MCDLCGDPVDMTITHPFSLKPESDNECVECDRHLSAHPDKEEYLAKREMENIIRNGHTTRFIFGDGPSFCYSIGRTIKDRPELLITGSLPPETLTYIVNRVAELDDESPLKAGDVLDTVLGDGYKVKLVAVSNLEDAEMFGVVRHFGTLDPTALQILWPDSEHRWPTDPEFGYPSGSQPVYT